jgi:hypothetical protein
MAPSVHNTQPWVSWIRADDRLELRAMVSGPAEPICWNRYRLGDPALRLVFCG